MGAQTTKMTTAPVEPQKNSLQNELSFRGPPVRVLVVHVDWKRLKMKELECSVSFGASVGAFRFAFCIIVVGAAAPHRHLMREA